MRPLRSLAPMVRPAALVLALAAAYPAWGEPLDALGEVEQLTELSLEQLLDVQVTSASKYAQRISDAPASVTVLTADDFKTYGWRTLADALRSARGLHVTYDRAYSYLGVRGFQRPGDYNSRVLLLVDGYRVNDNVYDSAFIGTEFGIDIDLIDHIEIVRGPSSSVYGGNALFGVINVVTKSASAIGGLETAVSVERYDTREGRVTLGKEAPNGVRLLLSASGYRSDGPTLSFPGEPSTGGAPVSDTDWDDHSRFYGKLEYQNLKISVAHSDREKGVTGGLWETPIDPRNLTQDRYSFLDAAYYTTVGPVEASARVAYSDYQYIGDYYYHPAILSIDKAIGKWWNAELKGVTTLGRHKLVFGVEYQDNLQQDQINFDVGNPVPFLDDRRSSTRTGLYVQDDIALARRLTFSAGARYDGYSGGEGQVNPRLGLIYRVAEPTVVKLLYGTAFRPANAYERFYAFPETQVGNPDLQPEEIETWKIAVETFARENLRLLAGAYHYHIDNLINLGTDPVFGLSQFQNIDQVTATGIELEGEYVARSGAKLRSSYAWQRAEDSNGTRLTNSPQHLFKLNASAPLGWNLRGAVETQYVSSRRTALSHIPGYTVTNFTLSTERQWHGWQLSASVYNAFGESYSDPAELDGARDLLEQDGRNYRLKAVYRF